MRMHRTHHLETASPEETEALGRSLGATAPAGGLLALVGELGAGKTCLVRGLAIGLGADDDQVQSPSFVIMTEYRGGRLPVHHIDLYRLEPSQIDEIWLRDALYGTGVAAVEWFDRLPAPPPDDVLRIELRHGTGDRRIIQLIADGGRHVRWLTETIEA